MLDNLSIVVHAFTRCILVLLSVNEILLPRYVNSSANSKGLPLEVEMGPFFFFFFLPPKHMNFVLFVFKWRPIPHAASLRLCSKDSALAGVFVRNARSLIYEPSCLGLYNTSTVSLQKGKTPSPNACPGYDTKQSDGEVPVILNLWGMRSAASLPSLPGPLL